MDWKLDDGGLLPDGSEESRNPIRGELKADSETRGGEPLIRISGVNIYYGKLHVLKNINLTINEKTTTVIMGPSGCGKTTLLRTLNRMNDDVPNFKVSGEVTLGGVNIYSKQVDPTILRLRVGMVFQKPNPFPISIFDNVAFGPRIHHLARNREELELIVREALKRAALWDEVKDRLKENALKLSGGQQQRLCIARALAVNPQILLLDEPTSSLDPSSTSRIEELIFALKKDYTVILVTHNMRQAAKVADMVVFLYNGEVVEVGKSPEIFEHPINHITKQYISGSPIS